MTTESEIRADIREILNGLSYATDSRKYTDLLKRLCQYLPTKYDQDSTEKPDNAIEVFVKTHYVKTAKCLLNSLSVDLNIGHGHDDIKDCFEHYFLEGSCEDAFLVLLETIWDTSPSFKLNRCLSILELFLKRHKLATILQEQSAFNKPPDLPMYNWRTDGRMLIWDALISEMAALPDKMANKLKSEVGDIFRVKNYIPLLIAEIFRTLTAACKHVRLSKDCHLEFVSTLVGKLCLCGYADQFWSLLLPQVMLLVRKDYIWSRVIERVVIGVPDRCMESVLVPLVKLTPWYGLMDRFLGNSVTQKYKIRLLFCTKLIFHQYFSSPLILQNIIGYLATSAPRQHLFVKLLKELLEVWGDRAFLKKRPYQQHYYLTQAIITCMVFITDSQKTENKDDLLQTLMTGVEAHISQSDHKVRKLGMLVAEVVTKTIDPDGPKLNFEVEEDEEIMSLKSLLTLPPDPLDNELLPESFTMLISEGIAEVWQIDMDDDITLAITPDLKPPPKPPACLLADEAPDDNWPSDLDSDDDLEPYDMSHDTGKPKVKQPKYIRDCMEGLISSDNPDLLEVCLGAAEGLIRANPDGLAEISTELAKILLHLTESHNLPNFRENRFNSLVALAFICPKPVAEYLTHQFYERNYSIRQRLDIIEVIGTAAQELSKPAEHDTKRPAKQPVAKIQPMFEGSPSEPESWREVVQKRIDSKTRRFGQGRSKPLPQPVENRFTDVAGYFFYPLMKNFDRTRQENTFDLMGEDCYVLCRLMYTLGIVMYAAANIPTVRPMASALLEFIWVLRYHEDSKVRQGLLFAISMVYLAVPPFLLLNDLQQDVFESKNWLEDVIDKDTDKLCKTLAVQALVLLENIIKQELLCDTDLT